jgi:hypothetical protein
MLKEEGQETGFERRGTRHMGRERRGGTFGVLYFTDTVFVKRWVKKLFFFLLERRTTVTGATVWRTSLVSLSAFAKSWL